MNIVRENQIKNINVISNKINEDKNIKKTNLIKNLDIHFFNIESVLYATLFVGAVLAIPNDTRQFGMDLSFCCIIFNVARLLIKDIENNNY